MSYRNILVISTLLISVHYSAHSLAAEESYPISVDTSLSGEAVSPAASSGLVTRSMHPNIIVKIHTSCFGANLRGVGNPISPNSIVTGNFTMNVSGQEFQFFVKFPGDLVANSGIKSATVQPMKSDYFGGTPANSITSAGIYGNTIVLNTTVSGQISVDPTGQVHEPPPGQKGVKLNSFQFDQVASCVGPAVFGAIGHSASTPAYPCGQYMGQTGVVSTVFKGISVAPDQSVVDIDFAFPGQTGFCGGYWSPLMVFLDEDRPKFDNLSAFPLTPSGKTYWPEKNSKGYFLALDKNGNNLIDEADELFGQNDGAENGFEALKKYDENKDGVIDAKDPIFKKLVLWNDANGDGVCEKKELIKASDLLVSISLKYKKGAVLPLGRHAEARESAEVTYKEKGKKNAEKNVQIKKAQIIDIWFASEK